MTRRERVVLIVLIGVPIVVACIVSIALVTLRRDHRASSPVMSATAAATIAETAAAASTTPPIEWAAPVASSGPPPPAWLTKVFELPSNPDAIKPTSVKEGTGKARTIGSLRLTSLNVYEYDVPPLTDVSLAFNPADIHEYTLTFDVPKSFDLEAVLRMKKLCDIAGDAEVFSMKTRPFETVCVTVDHGEKTDTTNEVSIESLDELRRTAKESHSSWLGDPERCGCP